MNNEEKQLLINAVSEIKSLRRRNEILEAKQQTFDSLMNLFHASPSPNLYGESPDLVWQIEKHLHDSDSESVKDN